MSAITQADNDEIDAQLLAAQNVIDGLSLVIAKQRTVMQRALDALDKADKISGYANNKAVRAALRNSLGGTK